MSILENRTLWLVVLVLVGVYAFYRWQQSRKGG